MTSEAEIERSASCSCGAVQVKTRGAPVVINACTCFDCQKVTGSTMSYTGFFPKGAVEVRGELRAWRGMRAAKRWLENHFCPTCGSNVLFKLEAFPDFTGVAAGCFSDTEFPAPQALYWQSRRHHWLNFACDIPTVDTQ